MEKHIPNPIVLEIIQNILGENSNTIRNKKEPIFLDLEGINADFKATQDSNLVDVGMSTRNFALGWSDPKDTNKGGKKSRAKGLEVKMGGKDSEVGPKNFSEPKKGCWTRLTD